MLINYVNPADDPKTAGKKWDRAHTFVDFDRGLNKATNRLRDARTGEVA